MLRADDAAFFCLKMPDCLKLGQSHLNPLEQARGIALNKLYPFVEEFFQVGRFFSQQLTVHCRQPSRYWDEFRM
jgi:hypothetical protein